MERSKAVPPEGPVLIVGAGEGLGAALARRFAAGGREVALTARNQESLERLARDVGNGRARVLAVPGDASSPESVRDVVERVSALGPPGTLIYNAGNYVYGDPEALSHGTFAQALAVGVYGAFLFSKAVLPSMRERGEGVMLFTGATTSVMAPAGGPAFAAAKFGLRGFALSLARDLRTEGIHVAHVIVDGVIATPGALKRAQWPVEEMVDPDGIADAYWFLAAQPPRAWSFELDVRTSKDDYLDN